MGRLVLPHGPCGLYYRRHRVWRRRAWSIFLSPTHSIEGRDQQALLRQGMIRWLVAVSLQDLGSKQMVQRLCRNVSIMHVSLVLRYGSHRLKQEGLPAPYSGQDTQVTSRHERGTFHVEFPLWVVIVPCLWRRKPPLSLLLARQSTNPPDMYVMTLTIQKRQYIHTHPHTHLPPPFSHSHTLCAAGSKPNWRS